MRSRLAEERRLVFDAQPSKGLSGERPHVCGQKGKPCRFIFSSLVGKPCDGVAEFFLGEITEAARRPALIHVVGVLLEPKGGVCRENAKAEIDGGEVR